MGFYEHIIVNDLFEFEDLFDVPLLLSADAREELSEPISTIGNDPNICKKICCRLSIDRPFARTRFDEKHRL